jgi:hypothetical protein
MRRHDQYGTHDEAKKAEGPTRAVRERDRKSAFRKEEDGIGKAANYGSENERSCRTSAPRRNPGSKGNFEGRDFERESYGGGYDPQKEKHDDKVSDRKGVWMRPGQVAGDGLSGVASERAFGSHENEQMSKADVRARKRSSRDGPKRRP